MTTSGFGTSGPVFIPEIVEGVREDAGPEAKEEPEDASPDEVAEEASVVAHLEDPETEAEIEHLRETRD
ncbi:hypothetical protein SAMN05216410_0513 [Sanguibacter gelidistatuariae]|uniref:Uncharacterized protein n=1 Tax=Sanguibacter gelidistatuariae TaxID=1814289 RepID=A0A1G6GWJ5_9MICO|nr:hypothetical protein [Sanguibacter gelidistatuariae]SDB86035.1 hypothetical protein SAMN05216410_0513 [Sanguibacter gelidistatuariae]